MRPNSVPVNAVSPPLDQNAGEVIGPDNFIHSVADLDRSVAFYRDTLGLKLRIQPGRAGGLPVPVPLSEALSDLTDTRGAKFRAATFELPDAGFGLELTEFTGVKRKAGEARTYDPGAAMLVLTVRDIDAVLSSVRKAGARIVTVGGEPVNLAVGNSGVRRFVFVRDPDGVLIELSQPDPLPSTTAAQGSQVIGGRFGIAVEDTEKILSFYHRVFGFESKPGAEFAANPVVQNGVGAGVLGTRRVQQYRQQAISAAYFRSGCAGVFFPRARCGCLGSPGPGRRRLGGFPRRQIGQETGKYFRPRPEWLPDRAHSKPAMLKGL